MHLRPHQILIVLFALLSSLQAAAQQKFSPGYVVTGTDTIRGFLKKDVESNLLAGVVFSENADGTPNRFYSSKEIQTFYFAGENSFQLINFTDAGKVRQQYFVKSLLQGHYNLYSFRKDERQYFVLTRNDSSFLLYDDKLLSTGQLDEAGNFRNQLFTLSAACDFTGLDNLPYSETSLINFVSKLNLCKEPGSNSRVLYKKEKTEVNFYVYAGGLPLGDKWEYTGRIIARFTLPSVNKHLSLNTGLSYMNKQTEVDVNGAKQKRNINIASAGLTIQNNFTSGIIQPYIEAGIGFGYRKTDDPSFAAEKKGFQSNYGIDLIGAIGIEAFINKQLVVKADWRYEIVTHYPTVGILFFFK